MEKQSFSLLITFQFIDMTTTERRELEAEIAVLVFGAERPLDKFYQSRYHPHGDDSQSVRFSKIAGWVSCPKYTTDPAAAMEALKGCARMGHVVTIEYTGTNTRGETQWMVCKLHCYSSGYSEEFCTCADTLELAICLFAKKLFSK